jgi:N-acetylglucosamine-6-phosphate deacetylase
MELVCKRYDTGKPWRLQFADGRIALSEPAEEGEATLPWLAPGLVDLQVNGFDGQEFSAADLDVERVAKIVHRHDAFGVASLCPTITTNSSEVIEHAARVIAEAAEQPGLARRIAGIHVEGPYISPADGPRGAHPLVHCRPPDWDEFQRWQKAASGRIRILTLSPEYDNAPPFIARAVESGVLVAIGHTQANSAQIGAAVDAGAQLSTHLGNGAHRTLPRHPNCLWDQLAEDRLTASLIVDGHHLPPEVVKTFVRAKTPDRCILVSDVSGLAGLPAGRYETELCALEILEDGRLVIAGQRQLLAGASRPLGVGIAGVMAMASVSLVDAITMATTRPSQLIHWTPGGFDPGDPADLVAFDLDLQANPVERFQVRQTIVAGERIYQAS